MRTFVLGDIHGAHKALVQCFQRSGFRCEEDRLIVMGDVCDGYPHVKECIEELLTVRHCDYIMGNHDEWALKWAETGWQGDIWLTQGGRNTITSYDYKPMPPKHVEFLKKARYYLELDGRLFVHGGFDPDKPIAEQDKEHLTWDRILLRRAYDKFLKKEPHKFGGYEEIFIGHTTTLSFQSMMPLHFCNVWAMDTGAGWAGKLTIMDVETKKFWQSDISTDLYPTTPGR